MYDQALSFKKVPDSVWIFFLKEAHFKTQDDLMGDIGLGNRAAVVVVQRLQVLMHEQAATPGDTTVEFNPADRAPLIIEGTEGMLLNFAPCCHPIPGDPIVGLLKAGKGIMVHVEACKRVVKFLHQPAHCVPLRWSTNVSGDFRVTVAVVVENERGVLAIMALAISDAEGNIDDIRVDDREGHFYKVTFQLLVKNRSHLAKILKNLRQVSQVVKITRAK